MRYLITFTLLVFCLGTSNDTQAQTTTWESYYREFTPQDEFLQTFKFPSPSGRQKRYFELRAKEKRMVKNHLKSFYGVKPTKQNYLLGAAQTSGQSVGRFFVYIATMSAAAIVVGAMLSH